MTRMDAGERIAEQFLDLPGVRMHIREAGAGGAHLCRTAFRRVPANTRASSPCSPAVHA